MNAGLKHRIQETADRIITAFTMMAGGVVLAIVLRSLGLWP